MIGKQQLCWAQWIEQNFIKKWIEQKSFVVNKGGVVSYKANQVIVNFFLFFFLLIFLFECVIYEPWFAVDFILKGY